MMRRPWRVLDEWSAMLSSQRLALLKICGVLWSFCHLRHPAGGSGREIGGDAGDVGENERVVVMDSIESGHNLWNHDVLLGFVFPGYVRHGCGSSSPSFLETNPLESTIRAGRRPRRDNTCPVDYSRKYPNRCRPCRCRVLKSLPENHLCRYAAGSREVVDLTFGGYGYHHHHC